MTAADDPWPVELRAPHGARVMEIEWSDGHHCVYPHEVLRGFCPCASCQGHGGPISYVEDGDLELTDIQTVGNYALRLVWRDCQTGIYSHRFLRKLCSCSSSTTEELKTLTFGRE